jgi:hypothetical protein
MAARVGISVSSVQRIWRSHSLQPHRMRQFKLSTDPQFAAKLRDMVGLYVDPPLHPVVLSLDERSQIQAFDRTRPGLPLRRCGTVTHDYVRNGTTTLFAALNVLEGSIIGRCMQRHRHQESIRFLNAIETEVPAGNLIHVIVDNYLAHKHPKVLKWLAGYPRWTFQFTPQLSGSHGDSALVPTPHLFEAVLPQARHLLVLCNPDFNHVFCDLEDLVRSVSNCVKASDRVQKREALLVLDRRDQLGGVVTDSLEARRYGVGLRPQALDQTASIKDDVVDAAFSLEVVGRAG